MFATQDRNVITFEKFLRLAERAGSGDPGAAMVTVLRSNRVPGIDIDRIVNNLYLNPSGNPGNILKFLCHIAENGEWGVNMDVVIR
jgi:hypothetical protein